MSAAQEYAHALAKAHPIPPPLKDIWRRDNDMIQNRAEWLANSLGTHLRDVHKKAPILLLPTGQFNACAAPVPKQPDEAVVLLELRITLALEYITELAFWSVLADDTDDADKLTSVAQSLCDLYALPILENQTLRCPEFVKDVGPEPAKLLILANSIAFIIGHEYAHVTEGHLRLARTRMARLGARDLEVFNYDQRLEIEADTVAFQRLINAAPSTDGPVLCAPFLVCMFFGALDHIHHCVSGDDPATSTHPSGIQRFGHLMDTFSGQLNQSTRSFAICFHQLVLQSLMQLDRCDLSEIAKCHEFFHNR